VTVTRGSWSRHLVTTWAGTEVSAWQLGDTDWWLRHRRGAAQALS
jgi:hypothetical protein